MTHNFLTSQFFLELISSTVTNILANRFGASPLDHITTEREYDIDLNQIETEKTGPFITPIHYGPVGAIPAEKFEKIFRLICHQWHQALMMFHQAIQGLTDLLFIYRRINSWKN